MNPQHHVLLVSPQAPPEWFFDQAAEYWKNFNPIVTTSADFIRYLPSDESLLLTILAEPESVDSLIAVIKSLRDDTTTYYDLITVEDDQLLGDIFHRRVLMNFPSGEPESARNEPE